MYRALNRIIWKMWRNGNSLEDIIAEVSDRTHWSGYLSLIYIVSYLQDRKIKLTNTQLRNAYGAVLDDVPEESREEAWKFLVKVGLL